MSPFAPMSDCQLCFLVAGATGKLWRKHRRVLPPPVRDALAALLLELRLFAVPAEKLSPAAQVGRARCDIRGIAELLGALAQPRERQVPMDTAERYRKGEWSAGHPTAAP